MKAWLLDRIGDGIDKLHLGDVTEARAGNGEVVLRMLAASLNPADRLLAENQYPAKPPLPHILGRDGVGVIEAVGDDLDESLVGTRCVVLPSDVGANRPGTFAALCAVPYEWVAPAPTGWTIEQSAAAPLVYTTAWQALTQWGELPPGIVLITGASGGVGVATIQLARSLGHTVVALSRDPKKTPQLQSLGASFVLDPSAADWQKQLFAATGGKRVDLAVDNIGGPLFTQLVDVMGNQGRISVVGRLGGAVPEFNTAALFFRRVRIGGVACTSYSIPERQAVWKQLVERLNSAGITPLVDSVHAFEELPAAFAKLQQGPMGKVVLHIADASPWIVRNVFPPTPGQSVLAPPRFLQTFASRGGASTLCRGRACYPSADKGSLPSLTPPFS